MTTARAHETTRGGLPRRVEPELLDRLDADDPRAVRSRNDLRLVNRLMGNAGILLRSLDRLVRSAAAPRLVELGGGDGYLMLRIARRRATRWGAAHLTLVDLRPTLTASTLRAFRDMGWQVEIVTADVLAWLEQADREPADIVVANLFMHHFAGAELDRLVSGIRRSARAFVCCEPRRTRAALAGSRLLGLLGCNEVTRHDAVASVHAGFRDRELSELWALSPAGPKRWRTEESAAGVFSHRFTAVAGDA